MTGHQDAAAHSEGEDSVTSEGTLVEAARRGSAEAFAELYSQHVGAAYTMARQVARSETDADDLVSEAFAKILDTLRRGGGPTMAFRAYLLTCVRNLAANRTNRERRLHLAGDLDHPALTDLRASHADSTASEIERSLAAQAFARLPARWRIVLWHTEVEERTPAEVASRFGMTSNGVSALAYRARKGLREAYLDVKADEPAEHRSRPIPPPRRPSDHEAGVDGQWTPTGCAGSPATEAAA
jgi:RNA polymerase sigma factor (sigma-70 family)